MLRPRDDMAGLKSVVTYWTLHATTSTGTHLRMEQSGFRSGSAEVLPGRRKYGWQKFLANLEQVLARRSIERQAVAPISFRSSCKGGLIELEYVDSANSSLAVHRLYADRHRQFRRHMSVGQPPPWVIYAPLSFHHLPCCCSRACTCSRSPMSPPDAAAERGRNGPSLRLAALGLMTHGPSPRGRAARDRKGAVRSVMPEVDSEGVRYSADRPQQAPGFFLKGCHQLDWGMKNRLARVFSPASGRTVMLAVDHGYFQGPTTGLERIDLSILPLLPALRCAVLARAAFCAAIVPAGSRQSSMVLRAQRRAKHPARGTFR